MCFSVLDVSQNSSQNGHKTLRICHKTHSHRPTQDYLLQRVTGGHKKRLYRLMRLKLLLLRSDLIMSGVNALGGGASSPFTGERTMRHSPRRTST